MHTDFELQSVDFSFAIIFDEELFREDVRLVW